MTTPLPTVLPVTLINAILPDEYQEHVVRQALTGCRQGAGNHVKRLKHALSKYIALPGFQYDASKALTTAKFNALCDRVIFAARSKRRLLEAVLLAWVETEPKLKSEVRAELALRGIPITGISRGVTAPPEPDIMALLAALSEKLSNSNLEDIRLMIACLSGQLPIEVSENEIDTDLGEDSDEDGDTSNESPVASRVLDYVNSGKPEALDGPEGASMHWHMWLQSLRELPAEAAEWDTTNVEAFIAAVQQLAEEKRQERVYAHQQLQQAIETLSLEQAEAIEFHELANIPNWHSPRVELNQALTIGVEVDHLRALLAEDSAKRTRQEQLKTHRERMAVQPAIDVLRGQIELLYSELDALLGPDDMFTPDGHDPAELASTQIDTDTTSLEEDAESASLVSDIASVPLPTDAEPTPLVTEAIDDTLDAAMLAAEDRLVPTLLEKPAPNELPALAIEQPPADLPALITPDGTLKETTPPVALQNMLDSRNTDVLDGDEQAEPISEIDMDSEMAPAPFVLVENELDDHPVHIWRLVAAQDLSGAAWALQETGPNPTAEVRVLAIAAAAQYIVAAPDSTRLLQDDHAVAIATTPFPSVPAWGLLALSAVLAPAICAPHDALLSWLRIPPVAASGLYPLITCIADYSALGIPLRSEMLRGVTGLAGVEARLAEASERSRIWLEDIAPARGPQFQRARVVWQRLVAPAGGIFKMLRPVANNEISRVDEVRAALTEWSDESTAIDAIHRLDMHETGSKARRSPIIADARRHLLSRIEDACEFARVWCDLTEERQRLDTHGDWVAEQVAALRDHVQSALPQARTAVDELLSLEQPEALRASATVLKGAVTSVTALLALDDVAVLPQPPAITVRSLDELLLARLLWAPLTGRDADGRPDPVHYDEIAQLVLSQDGQLPGLTKVVDDWISLRDWRFLPRLMPLVSGTESTSLESRAQEALSDAREGLRARVREVEGAIELAAVDGVIGEAERADRLAGLGKVSPETALDIAGAYEALEAFERALADSRTQRGTELLTLWSHIHVQMSRSSIPAGRQQQAHTFVIDALDKGNVRLVEEAIARIGEVLERGGELEDDWIAPPPPTRDALREFLNHETDISTALSSSNLQSVANAIREGRVIAGFAFGELDLRRRVEAADALTIWRRLKQSKSSLASSSGTIQGVSTILRYLGLTVPEMPLEGDAQIGQDWILFTMHASASDLARPIPQFGSLTESKYTVLCLWERPGAETIGARIVELGLEQHSILLLFFGRLTVSQRLDLRRVSVQRGLQAALLDDVLLAFLAREHDARGRFRVFLQVALAFTALNPFALSTANTVAEEMFYGRQVLARRILEGRAKVISGGRRLGKSTLLDEVRRRFHRPESRRYAWIEDIKTLGDPKVGDAPESIWRILRTGFQQHGLLSQKFTSDDPERLSKGIRDAVKDCRVILMLDEADNFLNADAARNFAITNKLRALMVATGDRFSVVFAGLHNVARFQGIPNQPLAQLGDALIVGPLEPEAAALMVREPMHALGYRFTDDTVVLSILTATLYHPLLIQLFCQDLVDRLAQRHIGRPPYDVDHRDVEVMFREPEVRRRVSDRFGLTLALDQRYQAIIWSIILDQVGDPGSYGRVYTAGEAIELARTAWSQGFEAAGTDEARALMDELVGLGVLVRTQQGNYRLRSPNIVRMLGTEEQILEWLDDLSRRPATPAFKADAYHSVLNSTGRLRRYSPLSQGQERNIFNRQPGASLILTSPALSQDGLEPALKRLFPREDRGIRTNWAEAPSIISRGPHLLKWLQEVTETLERYDRVLLLFRPASPQPEVLAELITAAVEWSRRSTGDRTHHLAIILDPRAAWAWSSLPRERRTELAALLNAVESPHRWNATAIRQRLELENIILTDSDVAGILAVSGGWHTILDRLIDNLTAKDDMHAGIDAFAQGDEYTETILPRLRKDSGIELNTVPDRVLKFLAQVPDGIPTDMIAPIMFEENPPSAEDLDNAVSFLLAMRCIEEHSGVVTVEPVLLRALEAFQ